MRTTVRCFSGSWSSDQMLNMAEVREWLAAHGMDCEITAQADTTTYRFDSDAEAMLFSLRFVL